MVMTLYWVVIWFGIGFGVPEGIALCTGNPQWTLSETVWRLFDVVPGQTPLQWSIVHYLFALAFTWVWVHFLFNAIRVWDYHKHGSG